MLTLSASLSPKPRKENQEKREGDIEEKEKKNTETKREVVDLGCAAREGQITIFSAALLQRTVCSIIIYCREREREKERGGVFSDAGRRK